MFSVVPGGREVLLPFTRMWLNTGENLVRRELKGKEGETNEREKGEESGGGTTTRKWRKKNNIHVCVYIICVCAILHTY